MCFYQAEIDPFESLYLLLFLFSVYYLLFFQMIENLSMHVRKRAQSSSFQSETFYSKKFSHSRLHLFSLVFGPRRNKSQIISYSKFRQYTYSKIVNIYSMYCRVVSDDFIG